MRKNGYDYFALFFTTEPDGSYGAKILRQSAILRVSAPTLQTTDGTAMPIAKHSV